MFIKGNFVYNIGPLFGIYYFLVFDIAFTYMLLSWLKISNKDNTYCNLLHPSHLCILFCGCIFGIVRCIFHHFCIETPGDHKMCLYIQSFRTHLTYHGSQNNHHIFSRQLHKGLHRTCDHPLGTYDSLIGDKKKNDH